MNNLIPLIKFNNKLRDELIAMEYLLRDFVSLVHISPQECDTVTFNRLNSRYQGIIRFSKIVLEEKYIRSTEKGESKGFNFIVNMHKVYEDFVTTMIEELIDEENEFNGYIVEKQKRFDSLVEEKEIISKPDVILKKRDSAGVYPLIIDAKYKRESSNSDYYQIIAYSLAIPTATSCCLVYPQTEKVDNKILHILTDLREDPQKSRKVKLHSLTIDLDRDLEFSEFTKEIKSDLKTKLLSCLQA